MEFLSTLNFIAACVCTVVGAFWFWKFIETGEARSLSWMLLNAAVAFLNFWAASF